MKKNTLLPVRLDPQGHLILPAGLLERYGLAPGATVRITQDEFGVHISRSSTSLACVYVEPTNACNLDCRTCMRNVWDEPLGMMSEDTFARILQGIQAFSPLPTVFFGGFGEPLAHAGIIAMVAAARQAGAEVELITNGTLLDPAMARGIIDAGLNRLWVSIDSATPDGYADVRLGAAFPQVISNLTRMNEIRSHTQVQLPRLGIAFVAMKRNISELPAVIRLGKQLGADQFSISNVLPHTAELQEQILYARSMYDSDMQPSHWSPHISLPRMDLDAAVIQAVGEIMKGPNSLQVARQSLGKGTDSCPFLEKGSVSIRWDGAVSPCLPLLHTHQNYLAENLRTCHAYTIGSIQDKPLADLWMDPAYVRLRECLQAFDFSPCTLCNSCEMAESNREDCFGNGHPACGGCLWAQGFIQCP